MLQSLVKDETIANQLFVRMLKPSKGESEDEDDESDEEIKDEEAAQDLKAGGDGSRDDESTHSNEE
jgi:hypothetical protein